LEKQEPLSQFDPNLLISQLPYLLAYRDEMVAARAFYLCVLACEVKRSFKGLSGLIKEFRN